MTADFYIKKLEQGFLVTQIPPLFTQETPKKEWAFATLGAMLFFLGNALSDK